MKLKKAGTHAWDVQKGNRVEYIYSGKKHIGTVVKAAAEIIVDGSWATRDIEIRPDDDQAITHMVSQRGNVRRLAPNRRQKRLEYAIKHDIPILD